MRENKTWELSHLKRLESPLVILPSLQGGRLAKVRLVPIGLEFHAFLGVGKRLAHLGKLQE